MLRRLSFTCGLLLFLAPCSAFAGLTADDGYDYFPQDEGLLCRYGELSTVPEFEVETSLGRPAPSAVEPRALLWECKCSIVAKRCKQSADPSLTCNLPGQDDPAGTPYVFVSDEDGYTPACPVRYLPNVGKTPTFKGTFLVGFSPQEMEDHANTAIQSGGIFAWILEAHAGDKCADACATMAESYKTDPNAINQACAPKDEQGNAGTVNEEVCIGPSFCRLKRPYCGDGKTQTWSPWFEECDDGDKNGDDSETCDANCKVKPLEEDDDTALATPTPTPIATPTAVPS